MPDAATLLCLAGLAHLIIWTVCAARPWGHLGDFHRYWDIATASRPPAGAPVEYPPGAVFAFGVLARLTGGQAGFIGVLLLLNLVADAAIVAILAAVWGLGAGAAYLVISAPIVSLLYFRYDLWSVAAATAAVACLMRGRLGTSLMLLVVGVALKLWPLPLTVWWLATSARSARPLRPWLWLGFACVVVGAAWVAHAGIDGLLGVLTYRGATGWSIESTVGSAWRILRPDSIRLEAGAIRAGTIAPWLSIGLVAAALPLACWSIYRGVTTHRSGLGWVTGIGAVLSSSSLLSPQFLAWMLPGAAIAWAEDDRRTTRWLAAVIGLTVAYRILHTTDMPGLVAARNLMLLMMVGDGVRRLRHQLAPEPRQHRPVVGLEPANPPAA